MLLLYGKSAHHHTELDHNNAAATGLTHASTPFNTSRRCCSEKSSFRIFAVSIPSTCIWLATQPPTRQSSCPRLLLFPLVATHQRRAKLWWCRYRPFTGWVRSLYPGQAFCLRNKFTERSYNKITRGIIKYRTLS